MSIGFPGMVAKIPQPSSGMGFANDSDTEVTELQNGARHVFNAPVSYKTFNMSWRAKTPSLQPLLDLYNKRYGNREFYISDPAMTEGNMLPPRWAYGYQLAHIMGGVGQPYIDKNFVVPKAVFNDKGDWNFIIPSIKVMVAEGMDHFFKVWGTRTGSAGFQVHGHKSGMPDIETNWVLLTTFVPTTTDNAPTNVVPKASTTTYDFIRIRPIVPTGGSMTVEHLYLGTSDYRSFENPRQPGQGVGAMRFTATLDGELVSQRMQRVGLSVDMTEVEYIRG